jgi:hypothetical protein
MLPKALLTSEQSLRVVQIKADGASKPLDVFRPDILSIVLYVFPYASVLCKYITGLKHYTIFCSTIRQDMTMQPHKHLRSQSSVRCRPSGQSCPQQRGHAYAHERWSPGREA